MPEAGSLLQEEGSLLHEGSLLARFWAEDPGATALLWHPPRSDRPTTWTYAQVCLCVSLPIPLTACRPVSHLCIVC
jgi:hypothetical protein